LIKGLGITPEQAQHVMTRYDVDTSGFLDVKEFELLLLKNEELRNMLYN